MHQKFPESPHFHSATVTFTTTNHLLRTHYSYNELV